MKPPTIIVFSRDLRVRDNPALAAAARESCPIIPLFVFDNLLLTSQFQSPNRISFLIDSLHDLNDSLTALGASLVVRQGDWVDEVLNLAIRSGVKKVHLTNDFSWYANKRLEKLERLAFVENISVERHPGVSVVPPKEFSPSSGGEYKIFTPYYRRWLADQWRTPCFGPESLVPFKEEGSDITLINNLFDSHVLGQRSPEIPMGGEKVGLAKFGQWLEDYLKDYDKTRDRLAQDCTSRLSPYLHFGCLSPLEVALCALKNPQSSGFVRQLCWRDFYLQVLAHRPDASSSDYRYRGDVWNQNSVAFIAWTKGLTGYPLVDAGMRQILHEGFMHNRARMVTASFLTKDLYLDWRLGAAHFMRYLVDGDIASNQLNWQWNAGTGTDSNPHRIFNPTRQAERFDPDGSYIRRWIPELSTVPDEEIHNPTEAWRSHVGYPKPIVDHKRAVAAYRAHRFTKEN